MKIISLSDYVNEYHDGNQTSAANSLITKSTGNAVKAAGISRSIKSDDFIVVVDKDKHTLCKIVAKNH